MTTTRKRRRRTRRKKRGDRLQRILLKTLPFLILTAAVLLLLSFLPLKKKAVQAEPIEAETEQGRSDSIDWFGAPDIDVQLLTVNEYSRPGIALKQINGIVIHYTANPGSSAQANRNYFENLKSGGDRKVSSHFVIGIEGEVIQCVPTAEIAYASNDRNTDTVSVECCHPDETGAFTDATYDSLVQLTAWLCKRFSLDGDDVIRHYDVTGKECPLYYVEHEDAWKQFRQDVEDRKARIIEEEAKASS